MSAPPLTHVGHTTTNQASLAKLTGRRQCFCFCCLIAEVAMRALLCSCPLKGKNSAAEKHGLRANRTLGQEHGPNHLPPLISSERDRKGYRALALDGHRLGDWALADLAVALRLCFCLCPFAICRLPAAVCLLPSAFTIASSRKQWRGHWGSNPASLRLPSFDMHALSLTCSLIVQPSTSPVCSVLRPNHRMRNAGLRRAPSCAILLLSATTNFVCSG